MTNKAGLALQGNNFVNNYCNLGDGLRAWRALVLTAIETTG